MNGVINIVDDDHEQAQTFAQMLGKNFGQILVWHSATEWMKAYVPTQPMVLIVDFFFPGERVSGEDVLDWIATNKHPIVPLVISGDVDVERCRDWMRKGAHYVIPKPITRAVFLKLAPALTQAREIAARTFAEYHQDLLVMHRLAACTQREREIVFRRLQGQSPQALADFYGCGYRTVVKHFSNAMRHLSGRENDTPDDAEDLLHLEHVHDKVRLYRLLRDEFAHIELRNS